MENPCFERFCPETKDLMSAMLIKDPKNRITCEEALLHPYFINMGFYEKEEKKTPRSRADNLSVIAEDVNETNK